AWKQADLEVHELANRTVDVPKGVIPATAQFVTVGVDLGKYLAHWAAVAWSPGATGHVLDYGRLEVPSPDLGVEQAIMTTLRKFRDEVVLHGWPVGTAGGPVKVPEQVWVDAGYQTSVVYAFSREAGDRFRPAVGRGVVQHHQHRQAYARP